jgi:hypothetical protein
MVLRRRGERLYISYCTVSLTEHAKLTHVVTFYKDTLQTFYIYVFPKKILPSLTSNIN